MLLPVCLPLVCRKDFEASRTGLGVFHGKASRILKKDKSPTKGEIENDGVSNRYRNDINGMK